MVKTHDGDKVRYHVSAQSAVFLDDPALYTTISFKSEKLEFRPLTDLLDPAKISPVMLNQGMDLHHFQEIRENLQTVIDQVLHEVWELVGQDRDRLWYCLGGMRYISKYDLPNDKYERDCFRGITLVPSGN
jgi:hypothetical protein